MEDFRSLLRQSFEFLCPESCTLTLEYFQPMLKVKLSQLLSKELSAKLSYKLSQKLSFKLSHKLSHKIELQVEPQAEQQTDILSTLSALSLNLKS